jgi:Ni,Fe-hydrogenase maturation factor
MQEISSFSTSTHTSSILLIIEYLKKFIEAECFAIGVRVEDSSFGKGISEEILEKANKFVDLILTQL